MPTTQPASQWRRGEVAQVLLVQPLQEVERGAFVRGEQIVWRDANGEREIMPVSEIR